MCTSCLCLPVCLFVLCLSSVYSSFGYSPYSPAVGRLFLSVLYYRHTFSFKLAHHMTQGLLQRLNLFIELCKWGGAQLETHSCTAAIFVGGLGKKLIISVCWISLPNETPEIQNPVQTALTICYKLLFQMLHTVCVLCKLVSSWIDQSQIWWWMPLDSILYPDPWMSYVHANMHTRQPRLWVRDFTGLPW